MKQEDSYNIIFKPCYGLLQQITAIWCGVYITREIRCGRDVL